MEAGTCHVSEAPPAAHPPAIGLAPAPPEPCTPAELRAIVHAGGNDSDLCERVLVQVARIEAALDLEIGDGLLAITAGSRLIGLGFSNVGDYANAILDIKPRTAQAMIQLSRELRSRPQLRAAVRAGEVRPRNALTVLPVAKGDAEAEWTERARTETVRALEKAVRDARAAAEGEEDEWTRFGVRLSPEDRAIVDEALAIAGRLMPGSKRPQRLEAMAQEYLGEHAGLAGDDPAWMRLLPGVARRNREERERREAKLEEETFRWSYLSEAGAHEETQLRAARIFRARVPVRIASDLEAAFRAVRAALGPVLGDGACLVRVARHFMETWKPQVEKARTLSQRVRERDLDRCRVPGCSRRAVHSHHVWLGSQGGPDGEDNLTAVCACHHLRGLHGGFMTVRGVAPDRLVWEVRGRPFTGGVMRRPARTMAA